MKGTAFLVTLVLTAAPAAAQREHTRLVPRGTTVTQAQAEALTLTVGGVAPRLIQTWVRVAGEIDANRKILRATVSAADAAGITVGQRVRAFSPSSKSSMYQAFVTRVGPRGGPGGTGVAVEATLASTGRADSPLYVMEIVVEQGPFLSVPNEAIIEEGEKHIVYVQERAGQYAPKEIQTGRQGELYTEVTSGVKDGDQVVTIGSFFIDAEQKLKK